MSDRSGLKVGGRPETQMTMRFRFAKCLAVGTVALATLGLGVRTLAQSAVESSPAAPPSPPELPDYLRPPTAPPEPTAVRPRQLPVRPSIRPATPPYRVATPARRRPAAGPFPLAFNGELQETTATPGATNVAFEFRFTNTSPDQVSIQRVHTSCGCTTAQLPAMPWVIEADGEGSFDVAMDIRGKRSQISKMVYLYTDKGFKALTVRALIPADTSMPSTERLRNLQIAAADRQAVFRGDCARCHSEPAKDRQGRALFQAVCAVCHEAEHRADMVPDLRRLDPMPDEKGWQRWVTHGKARTLMPAFADTEGGPLTPEQIDSLVGHLVRRFPQRRGPPIRPPGPPAPPAP